MMQDEQSKQHLFQLIPNKMKVIINEWNKGQLLLMYCFHLPYFDHFFKKYDVLHLHLASCSDHE